MVFCLSGWYWSEPATGEEGVCAAVGSATPGEGHHGGHQAGARPRHIDSRLYCLSYPHGPEHPGHS